MSTKVDLLRKELESLTLAERLGSGDEGLILIRPTKAQNEQAVYTAASFPVEQVLTDLAVVLADAYCESLEQQGMRPADFWRIDSLSETIANRVAAALKRQPSEFSSAFRATMKGRG
jgi:hypothetical protein